MSDDRVRQLEEALEEAIDLAETFDAMLSQEYGTGAHVPDKQIASLRRVLKGGPDAA